MSFYNHHVLQPYVLPPLRSAQQLVEPHVLPPIRQALHHPSVHPYVQKAEMVVHHVEPYVVRGVLYSREFADRVRYVSEPYILRAGETAADLLHHYVVPQYVTFVRPHLDKHVVPVVSRLQTLYENDVAPFLTETRGIVVSTYSTIAQIFDAYILRTYHATQPYVVSAWRTSQPYLFSAWGALVDSLRWTAINVGHLRKEYVDPHVHRIWDKVVELSDGEANGSSIIFPPDASETPFSDTFIETIASDFSFSTPASQATTVVVTEISQVTTDAKAAPSDAEGTSTYVSHATPVESLEPLSSAKPSNTNVPLADSVGVAAEPAQNTPSVVETDGDDLGSFMKLLGLGSHAAPDTAQNDQESASTPSADPSEVKRLKAEKLAERRRGLFARQAKWTQELDQLIKSKTDELRLVLVALRKSAVYDLKQPKGDINWLIDSMQAEGEKMLKGLDIFLRKEAESSSGEDAKELWVQLYDKVEDKFSDKVLEVQGVVTTWYASMRKREMQAVERAAASVKTLAERAQADVGLDYAWLEDVTYDDWQKYHDLMRASDHFTVQVHIIQNGTHPSPPEDPLTMAMSDLQEEVRDIILGFNVRMRDIKVKGFDLFPAVEEASGSEGFEPEPEVSILPTEPTPHGLGNLAGIILTRGVSEVEKAFARANDFLAPEASPAHEEVDSPVSILPIDDTSSRTLEGEADLDALLLSRGKNEIEEALGRATSDPLSAATPYDSSAPADEDAGAIFLERSEKEVEARLAGINTVVGVTDASVAPEENS
ncbi:hypothetical protein FISHEDRAFT_34395 [Fistulina hepatica ATCC 64428]|uniref:Uncharacterized protein n=1 Tax=Fistulina hepatica ATCC 64428 TaxID=1128425 RepID=A0A0D7AM71_9AGAR|nr:hypothetical protein FISHEDRAFT_34395 [Fistulina hepatica ATCC 64428]